jgi:hypothetical protein
MPSSGTNVPRARRRSSARRRTGRASRPTMKLTYLTAPDPALKRLVGHRSRPAACASSAISMDTACNTLTVATAISSCRGTAHRFRFQPRHVTTSSRET